MKNLSLIILVLFCISNTYAQIGIKADNTAPIPSAQLEVQSTTKAFYPPRMTTAQRTTLTNNILNPPQEGAMVFDTDLNGLFTYNGASWVSGSGLTLPYSVSQSEVGSLLRIVNTNTNTNSATIRGETNSLGSGYGIYGIAANLTPSGASFGVSGLNVSTNSNGVGVYGQHNGTGTGVQGQSLLGYGVVGIAGSGTAGYFSANNYALITGNGNVGFGTNTPTNAKLHILGSSFCCGTPSTAELRLDQTSASDFARLKFTNANSTSNAFFWDIAGLSATSGNEANAFLNFYYQNGVNTGKNIMSMLGNGNVGIGTNTPNAPLQFSNAAVNRKVVLYETANNNHQFYGLGINGFTFRYQVDDVSSSHVFYAATGTTTSNELMRVRGDGNVGIGNVNPSEKLDVSGNIKANGEINRTQTTDANLVPIAYGNVLSNGSLNSTSTTANVLVSKVSTGVYQISITGETYNANDYTTQVTLNGSSTFGFIVTSSGAGILNVYTANVSGTATDRAFTFVVYKK